MGLIRRKNEVQYDSSVMLKEIQKKREIMIETANMKGYTNDDTIRHSQELDQLIYDYQRYSKKMSIHDEQRGIVFQQMMLILPQLNVLV